MKENDVYRLGYFIGGTKYDYELTKEEANFFLKLKKKHIRLMLKLMLGGDCSKEVWGLQLYVNKQVVE